MRDHCPVCDNDDIRQSSARGFLETTLLPLLLVRPYRCRMCHSRFYRFSLQNGRLGRKKQTRRRNKEQPSPTEELYTQFLRPADHKSFEELIAEIREAEKKIFGDWEQNTEDRTEDGDGTWIGKGNGPEQN